MTIFEGFVRSRIYLAALVTRTLFPRASVIVGVSADRFTLLHTHASSKGMLTIHKAFYDSTKMLAEYVANNSGIEG